MMRMKKLMKEARAGQVQQRSPYMDCVSSISSYRRKRSTNKLHKEHHFRTALQTNIRSCKLVIKQGEDALLESAEDRAFYSASIMRVVQQLVVSSSGRSVQRAFNWWHQRTRILRVEELKRKALLKSKRSCLDDFIGESIQAAIDNILASYGGRETDRKSVLFVQKITRIRGKNKLIAGDGDGRESLFVIPKPRFSA